MEQPQYDWFAIIIAAAFYMLIGAIWYSNLCFGGAWTKLSKLSEAKSDRSIIIPVLGNAIIALIISFFLAFFAGYIGITTVSDGVVFGFFVWLGFVATTQVAFAIWNRRHLKLFLIDTGAKLLSYIVMGGIIGA